MDYNSPLGIEKGASVIGYPGLVASWQRYRTEAKIKYQQQPYIILMMSAAVGESVYEPPQSISVSGKEALIALRDAVDEALKYETC